MLISLATEEEQKPAPVTKAVKHLSHLKGGNKEIFSLRNRDQVKTSAHRKLKTVINIGNLHRITCQITKY